MSYILCRTAEQTGGTVGLVHRSRPAYEGEVATRAVSTNSSFYMPRKAEIPVACVTWKLVLRVCFGLGDGASRGKTDGFGVREVEVSAILQNGRIKGGLCEDNRSCATRGNSPIP